MLPRAASASARKAARSLIAQNASTARQNRLTQHTATPYTQTRGLYFCGPKAGAHPKPMPEHYFAGPDSERWITSSHSRGKSNRVLDKDWEDAEKEMVRLEKIVEGVREKESSGAKVARKVLEGSEKEARELERLGGKEGARERSSG